MMSQQSPSEHPQVGNETNKQGQEHKVTKFSITVCDKGQGWNSQKYDVMVKKMTISVLGDDMYSISLVEPMNLITTLDKASNIEYLRMVTRHCYPIIKVIA